MSQLSPLFLSIDLLFENVTDVLNYTERTPRQKTVS